MPHVICWTSNGLATTIPKAPHQPKKKQKKQQHQRTLQRTLQRSFSIEASRLSGELNMPQIQCNAQTSSWLFSILTKTKCGLAYCKCCNAHKQHCEATGKRSLTAQRLPFDRKYINAQQCNKVRTDGRPVSRNYTARSCTSSAPLRVCVQVLSSLSWKSWAQVASC